MTDLSAKIAQMLHTGDGIADRCERNDFSRMVDLILEEYPKATSAEIVRGFQIAGELMLMMQEEAEAMAEGRR